MIEVAPLAFMRGRTLNDSFVILDEAQNTTPEQMKMFLTRLGFGSKMVITGDITQVDLPRDQQSGPDRRRATSSRRSRASTSSASAARTSSATGSSSASSRPTTSTPSALAPELRPADAPAPRVLDVEVLGAPRRRAARGRDRAARRARARLGRASRTATSRSQFVDADAIAELNAEHRGKNGPTDVLSFPVDEAGAVRPGPRELGDVVICPAHTEDLREAIVHGALHLAGMDHETDDGEMLALQAEILD